MRPPGVSPEALINELASVFRDPEEAKLVALHAGFPSADLPAFRTPRVFWSRVMEAVTHGKVAGGMQAITDVAARLYPGNGAFGGRHSTTDARPAPVAAAAPGQLPATKQTILFLASNSSKSGPLALQREAKHVAQKIRAATFREHFGFSPLGEATPGDFQDALLQERPTIVHFSGHGRLGAPDLGGADAPEPGHDMRGGIVMCSETPGEEKLVDGDALASTLALYEHVRLLVLNACHSLPMATMVAQTVDFAIGMDGVIGDEGARLFSVGLYRGLAHGRTVQAAFEMGVAEMKLGGCKRDAMQPKLRWRSGVDPTSTHFTSGISAPAPAVMSQSVPTAGTHEHPQAQPTSNARRTSGTGPRPKANRREFRQNLDRHSQWARFKDACDKRQHLVMWAVGDRNQSLELFYDRIKLEYPRQHQHNCYSFGIGPGDDATAQEWEDLLRQSVPNAIDDSLDGAIAAAARDRPALFVLDNQRGPLDEDTLGEPHMRELVEFIESHVLPAVERVDPPHPVRLFVGIQKRGKSSLAKMLRDLVRRARKDWPQEPRGRRGIGRWEAETIRVPTRDEVIDSIEDQLEPAEPLSEDERDAVETEYEGFVAKDEQSLRILANRLYPLYVQFYAARAKSTSP